MKIPEEYTDPNKKRIERPPPNRRSCIVVPLVLFALSMVQGVVALVVFWLPVSREREEWCLEQFGMPCLEVEEYVDSFLHYGTEKDTVMAAIESVSPSKLYLCGTPNNLEEWENLECYEVVLNETGVALIFARTFCFDDNGKVVYAITDPYTDFSLVHPDEPTPAP